MTVSKLQNNTIYKIIHEPIRFYRIRQSNNITVIITKHDDFKNLFFFLRQLLNGDLDTKSKYLKALIFSSKVPKHLFNQLQIGYLTVLILEAWNSLYNFV